jgi:hypothetical protein
VSVPFSVSTTGTIGPQNAGQVFLCGASLRETSGTSAATVDVHEGGAATGAVVASFALAAGGSLPPGCLPSVRLTGGAYVTVTGSVTGSLYLE